MTKLSDTQLVILSNAGARPDRNALPLPGSLRGRAAAKVVGALLSRSLVAERFLEEMTTANASMSRIWRNEPDGRAVLLEITEAGLAAIGVEADGAELAGQDDEAPGAPLSAPLGGDAGEAQCDGAEAAEATRGAAQEARKRKLREGTKQAALIAMLRSPEGAAIAEIVAATGWQAHTVRGAMSGALKKKFGLEATSAKVEGRGRVYRLPTA